MPEEQLLEEARQLIARSQAMVALTGAGISAESGVPTFRGKEGLWKNYSPEELATPQAFARNPLLVWEWYQWRRGLIAKVKVNAGHLALAQLERMVPDFTLVTQNVDGLHGLAGSKQVLEIHGSIWKTLCAGCGETRENRELELELPPRCSRCDSLLRPAVVWFGESLDQEIMALATAAISRCDLMIVVGTSGVVQPVASFPFIARDKGAAIIEVNLERTPVSSISNLVLLGKAAQLLPRLVPP